jgi:hypothetical protein
MPPAFFNLTHADCHLGWPELGNDDRFEERFA